MIDKNLKILEAVLFASGEPIEEKYLGEKIDDSVNVKKYLNELKQFYEQRGVNLINTGNKWSFRTSSELSSDLTIFKSHIQHCN